MASGRIIKGVGGLYFVDTGREIYECQARGLFRKQKIMPLVGDLTEIAVIDEKKRSGYLMKLLPRKNELFRPRVANIDCAVIVFSVSAPALSAPLLDKFIALVERQGLEIILCFNKTDLSPGAGILTDIYSKIGYPTVLTSAFDKGSVDRLSDIIKGRTAVLAGPSGVGKSSIVNAILSEKYMETGELSKKIDRGKHTTRHAEFLKLASGGFIVDTPGFASVSTENIPPAEFQFYFREFSEFLGKCRFKDCMHVSEPGCAVKEAVGTEISELRYKSYLDLLLNSGERGNR